MTGMMTGIAQAENMTFSCKFEINESGKMAQIIIIIIYAFLPKKKIKNLWINLFKNYIK